MYLVAIGISPFYGDTIGPVVAIEILYGVFRGCLRQSLDT